MPPRLAADASPRDSDHRRGVLPFLALALLVRILPFLAALEDPERFYTLDARGYISLARNLAAGYFDPVSALWPVGLMRTPGYPVFAGGVLALGLDSILAVILAQIALSLLAIFITHKLATRLVGRRAANLSALLLALDPATAIYANLLQPESLFTVLVLLSVVCWLNALDDGRPRSAAFAGFLAGLATLTRPIGLLMPIPLLLVAATHSKDRNRRLAQSVALVLAFGTVVGAWIARNAAYTGIPLLSTIEGVNLLNYRAAGALAIDEGRNIEEVRLSLARRVAERGVPSDNEAAQSRAQSQIAIEVLSRHPYGALRSAADGLFRIGFGTGLTALSGLRGDLEPERIVGWFEMALQTIFAALLGMSYVGAFLGLVRLLRRKNYLALSVTAGFVFYFALISAGPEATTRFRVPLMPFVAILAGTGFASLLERRLLGAETL